MPSMSIASRKRRSLGVSTLNPPRMRPSALMMSVGSVMPGEVLGEQATLDVGRPAGCEVDQDSETLARVEGIIGVGHRCGHRENGAKRDDGAHPKHRDPPRVLFCTSLTA